MTTIEAPHTPPKPAAKKKDTAAEQRVKDIDAELKKIEADRKVADADLAEALAATPLAKAQVVDQLQARADALVKERAKLTPPPEPNEDEVAEHEETLKRSGWTDNGNGTWTNTVPFVHGENIHVPAGVTRPFGDAVTLESQRPK